MDLDVFLTVVSVSYSLAFLICVFLLFVLFCIAFRFALLFFYSSSVVDCSLSLCLRSGIWQAKSAAALRCRLFPEQISHWCDIGSIMIWNGNGPAWRNRIDESEELPISDGPENGLFPGGPI